MLVKGLNLTVKIVLISAVLLGCASDERDRPGATPPEGSGILEKDAFVEIMTDAYLVEASYKSHVYVNENEQLTLEGNYSSVFQKHGITQEELEASHTWWCEHPAAMKNVLQEVTESLIYIEKTIDNQAEAK